MKHVLKLIKIVVILRGNEYGHLMAVKPVILIIPPSVSVQYVLHSTVPRPLEPPKRIGFLRIKLNLDVIPIAYGTFLFAHLAPS